jgi:hypothetical protein
MSFHQFTSPDKYFNVGQLFVNSGCPNVFHPGVVHDLVVIAVDGADDSGVESDYIPALVVKQINRRWSAEEKHSVARLPCRFHFDPLGSVTALVHVNFLHFHASVFEIGTREVDRSLTTHRWGDDVGEKKESRSGNWPWHWVGPIQTWEISKHTGK